VTFAKGDQTIVWDAGFPKVAGSGRKGEYFAIFAIDKMQRGGSQQIQDGNLE